LTADPRFTSNPERVTHHDELTAIIEDAFATRTADEVSEALEAAGIANARLRTPAEFTRHPQLAARDRWRTVHTPAGEIDALLPPVEMAGVEAVMRPVPRLGEHTAAVRAEFGEEDGSS
jgi:itaconate CoA-transferase